MWANSVVAMLTMITVATQNLITGRPTLIAKPFVELRAVVIEAGFLPELAPVVVDVIEVKEQAFGFTAAGASVPTVSLNGGILEPVVVGQRILPALFGMVLVPFCSTIGVDLSQVRLSIVFLKPFLGTDRPFSSVLENARPALLSMPAVLVLNLMAFGTFFNHGLTSVIKSIYDYANNVKGKAQRSSRQGVGASAPKRLAARTADDMICSAWKHAAA